MAKQLTPSQRKKIGRILAAMPFITLAIAAVIYFTPLKDGAISLVALAVSFFFSNLALLRPAKAATPGQESTTTES